MNDVIHDQEYVAWVKRTLNRMVFAGLKTDGQVNRSYRLWVEEFQARTGLTPNGKVDKATQDYLIALNNVSTNGRSRWYVTWVQQALLRLNMGSGVIANGELTKETKDAIKKFQVSVKHKHIDGVVGSKTEIDLAKKVPDLMIPGYYPGGPQPAPDPAKQREEDWLKNKIDSRSLNKQMESWINLYIRELDEEPLTILDPEARRAISCMLYKLRGAVNIYHKPDNYDYLPEQTVRDYARGLYLGEPIKKHTRSAIEKLRGEVGNYPASESSNVRYTAFKLSIHGLYLTIDNGIREIYLQVSNGSGVLNGTYAILDSWYDRQSGDKTSLISCLPSPRGKPHHPF